MRLIDADALRKAIDKIPYANIMWETLAREDVVKAIIDAPTVDGWISVKDRLPEDNSHVIVYDEDSKVVWLSRYMDATFYVENHSPNFTYHVNWWRPLPEPPEEVKDEV